MDPSDDAGQHSSTVFIEIMFWELPENILLEMMEVIQVYKVIGWNREYFPFAVYGICQNC